MKIRHVETLFRGIMTHFSFSRKAAKSQRKTKKELCVSAALRENGINIFLQPQSMFISPGPDYSLAADRIQGGPKRRD
jgi:hypothetical protein